jgi:outer membrane receptor protein involved in Fe transport
VPLESTSTTSDRSGSARIARASNAIDEETPRTYSDQGDSGGETAFRPYGLQEVVVTAQKREERLQDVPIPVTAIAADALLTNDQVRIQDYFTSVPGFNVSPSPSAGAEQTLSLRGITTGFGTTPTVGITVDDVPIGSSGNGLGNTVPDFDPNDLARVEVLRGPQGTLYGADSMGGLVKFVTIDPSTDRFSGHVQASLSNVHNGAEVGYGVRAGVNVPLTDDLAIRVSAFTREDPGYIDNPVLGNEGVNKDNSFGGRVSALWKPSDAFSIKVGALYQRYKGDGSNDVDVTLPGYNLPPLGKLQQDYIKGIGGYDKTFEVYSAVIKAKLGPVDLTSVSGYNLIKVADSWDYSYLLGGLLNVAGAPVFTSGETKKLTQEVRLSSSISDRVDWLIGGFYTHEFGPPFSQQVLAEDTTTGALVGNIYSLTNPNTYDEYAGFADLTVHITDRFNIQFGGRESHIKVIGKESSQSGALVGDTTILTPGSDWTGNAFTYLVTPQFKVSPDLMTYLRFASGYRAGGNNATPGSPQCVTYNAANVPCAYSPDKTENYEIGVKGDVLNHALSFDMSVYYIDWRQLQINLFSEELTSTYTSNAGRAKSDGVELSVEARPFSGLKLSSWLAYALADLTEVPPSGQVLGSVYENVGDRLPYSTRFSGNIALDQEFPITRNISGFVGVTESYVGGRLGSFTVTPQREYYSPYSQTDLRVGARLRTWTLNLFVNNATDKRGVLGGGMGTYPPFAFRIIQPRTIGLSVSEDF